eukprot:TRINITY_DN6928_c0_g1_i1.p1 TRINITY_DN6928_c0_g1~~TRINITY_DN6928_c0_g1_i1.p1  ORF type:complete len:610 (+),score=153.11 TRINITY_DN6928_c0_g1_i1:65-1894(+)
MSQSDFNIYAVLDNGLPRRMTAKPDGSFYSRISVPLPDHAVIYGIGTWPAQQYGQISINLGTMRSAIDLGAISAKAGARVTAISMTEEQKQDVDELIEQESMAKLTVTMTESASSPPAVSTPKPVVKASPDSGHPSPEAVDGDLMDTHNDDNTDNNDIDNEEPVVPASQDLMPEPAVPQMAATDNSDKADKSDKSHKPGDDDDDTLALTQPSQTSDDAIPCTQADPPATQPDPVPTTQAPPQQQADKAVQDVKALEEQAQAVTKTTKATKKKSSKRASTGKPAGKKAKKTASKPKQPVMPKLVAPTGRWGHSFTAINATQAILFGGQGEGYELCKDYLWLYDCDTADKWHQIETSGPLPPNRMGHTAVFYENDNALIIYGGAKKKRFLRDVHMLNLETMEWSVVEVNGKKGPALSYHSCVISKSAMYVWGGVFPMRDPLPDGCSKQLHVFDLKDYVWCEPITVGADIAERSGHSATLVDGDMIIFGGWDEPKIYNDVHKLDLSLMEFTKIEVTGQAPEPRSWMLSVPVVYKGHKAVYFHGGYNGVKALRDTFILDLEDKCWVSIEGDAFASGRAGHAIAMFDTTAVAFAGGDNEGRFFNSTEQIALSVA